MNARAQRSLVGWLLLVLLALVVTPRGYLHHCELAHHHAASEHASVLSHCSVCDEVLPVSTAADVPVERTITSVTAVSVVTAMADPLLGHALTCADRGPPARA